MNPIYFPHTYLNRRVMQVLPVIFSRFGVYLPSDLDIPVQMQRLADSGTVELRVPAAGDVQRLAAVLQDFRSWAALQSSGPGFDVSLLKAYHRQPPFFDAPFASQIRTDIGRRMTSQPSEPDEQPSEADRLLSARIFLSIAQQLDEQADSLDRDYAAVDARQQDLLRELQGEPPDAPTFASTGQLRADGHEPYMLAERLAAWAQLAAADPAQHRPDAPAVYVTASGEAVQQVIERFPQEAALQRSPGMAVPAETGEPLDGWRRLFLQAIAPPSADRPIELPTPPPPAPGRDSVAVQVVRIPHRRLIDLLSGSAASAAAEPAPAADTVIVAVGPAAESIR